METLGRLLKDTRAKHSLTQTEAAEQIGIEQSYLSKLESDQAWASLEVLSRVCRVYKTDVKNLLGQVDQESLSGNFQYQGFLQRELSTKRRAWMMTGGVLAVCLVISGAYILTLNNETKVISPTHTPISLRIDDVNGKDVLVMVAEYGDLTIDGLEQVDGKISNLDLKDEPWDIALARVALGLGFKVEITGAKVELIPIPIIFGSG